MNYDETETLKETVETDTEMKDWLVNYVVKNMIQFW